MNKFPPLSPEANQLLKKLIDLHWEITERDLNRENNTQELMSLWQLKSDLKQTKQALMDEMGIDHFTYFMNSAVRMFSEP